MKKEDLIKLGFVSRPHGIKGEAILNLINPEDSILENGSRVWLYPSSSKSKIKPDGEEWTIEKIRFGNNVITLFESITDRTHLESIIPFEVYMPREAFPPLEEGQIYLVDLINIDVVNESGEVIGKVLDVMDNTAQYLLRIRLSDGEEISLPYVDAFFPETDIENKKITMIKPIYTE